MAKQTPDESDLERGSRIRDQLAREQMLGYASTPTIVPDAQAKPASKTAAETPPKES